MKTTPEESATIAMLLGYEVSRSFKFHVFSKNTEDFSINKRSGNFKCWTGVWDGGDAIAFVQFVRDCSFIEAKEFVFEAIGRTNEFEFSSYNKVTNNDYELKKPIPEEYLDGFLSDSDEYKEELKNLFLGSVEGNNLPVCSEENMFKIAKTFQIKFVDHSKRLIMPIRDLNGEITTFWKYKKNGEDYINEDGKTIKHRKVLYSKERYRPPFSISKMLEYRENKDEYVLVTEGEKDALVAYANGLRAICIGGAGASSFIEPKYIELFKDMKIILVGDYDEAGKQFNSNLYSQLHNIANTITTIDWEKKAKKDGFKLFPKFDLADYFAWKFNKESSKKSVVHNNKVFAYFLNKIGETTKFRKTKYGYMTFDGVWRYFVDNSTITRTKSIKEFNGYDYDSKIEESKYMVINNEGAIKIQFALSKVY
ncbi:MAG TPA: hypothetical protein K8U92_07000 [Aliarcobacter thereius]|nr:hypothetical protein [Aliarcobacter thereius]HJE03611.1 hypothetical protein [Aliarcobacter thereius]